MLGIDLKFTSLHNQNAIEPALVFMKRERDCSSWLKHCRENPGTCKRLRTGPPGRENPNLSWEPTYGLWRVVGGAGWSNFVLGRSMSRGGSCTFRSQRASEPVQVESHESSCSRGISIPNTESGSFMPLAGTTRTEGIVRPEICP